MIAPSLQVAEGDHEGQFANIGMYVIGVEDDEQAKDPATWITKSMGAKQFAKLMRACQLYDNMDHKDAMAALKGRTFRAMISLKYDKFYEEDRNSIGMNGYFNPQANTQSTAVPVSQVPEPQEREAITIPQG